MYIFLKCHGDSLSLGKPTVTSFARALGFIKEDDLRFFQTLEEEFEQKTTWPTRGIMLIRQPYA
jgi:hypothetical protein